MIATEETEKVTLGSQIEKIKRLLYDMESGIVEVTMPLNLNIHRELRGPDGELKYEDDTHNLICTAGKNRLLDAATGFKMNTFLYVAIGTGATAEAITDTTVQTEVGRVLATASNPSASVYQLVANFAPGVGTGAITETGVLDAVSVGNLLVHRISGVVTKTAADTLIITVQIS